MTEEPPKRMLITPPPGLLPDAGPREAELPDGTDSATRRISRDAPVFFARPPGAPPVATAPDGGTAPDPDPDPQDDLDATVIAHRGPAPSGPTADPTVPGASWTLRTAEGVEHPVSSSGLVVGRNPTRPIGWEGAAVLGVYDPEKTVSKTHAALRVDGDELLVIDLSSTNGTTVTADATPFAVGTETGAPVPTGATILFGSYPVRVSRS